MARTVKSERVPKEMQARFDEIVALTDRELQQIAYEKGLIPYVPGGHED